MSTHVVLGTGSVGAPLARELVRRGHEVISVNRSGAHAGIPDSVERRVGDVTDPPFIRDVMRGADVTYQLTQPRYHRWADEFPALQRGVVDAAAAAGTRLVLADNLYCYGMPDGPIGDHTAESPISVKGQVRKAMADSALRAHDEGRVQVALTRPSNYLGADYALTRELLVEPALEGKPMSVLGRLDQPHSFAYVPDVARAMADIGTSDDCWGRSWVLPALEPMTQAELCERLWSAAGQSGPPKVRALRGTPMRLLSAFSARIRASMEMLYEMEHPFLVDSSDFERRFGWSATEIGDAIRDTVRGTRPDPIIAST